MDAVSLKNLCQFFRCHQVGVQKMLDENDAITFGVEAVDTCCFGAGQEIDGQQALENFFSV